jgi:outer membrane protein assembly factor BamE
MAYFRQVNGRPETGPCRYNRRIISPTQRSCAALMPDTFPARLGLALPVLACVLLAACGSLADASKVSTVVSPYRIDLVQGNVVTREQFAALRTGMPRQAVREVLGSPLLTSVFHADRWDYVFTFRRQGAEPQARHVTLFFKNDLLDRFTSDELPSEAEFVSTLKSGQRLTEPPAPLEASPQDLQKFLPAARPADTPAPAPASASYPPLEAAP